MDAEKKVLTDAERIIRVLRGESGEEEQAWFRQWLVDDPANAAFVRQLADPAELGDKLGHLEQGDTEASWQKILEIKATSRSVKPIRLWKYAAAVLLFASLGLATFTIWPGKSPATKNVRIPGPKTPIVPGTDKARLVLADGSEILLDEAANGLVGIAPGIRIHKEKGMLVYEALDQATADPDAINTIYTPRGGQYQVKLPDDTRVWLNAASSLTYPVSFTGNERRVTLSGEGYFEVARDKSKPFRVKANGTEIVVLGTHFNVAAYPEEGAVRTTLLEGSVNVLKNTNSRTLLPGQEALSGETRIEVTEADAEEAIAWKNGVFLFKSEDIDRVMLQLGRWYDVEIVYSRNAIPEGHISGKISRKSDITKVLNLLELAGGVHFKIDERKVTISD